MSLRQGSMAFTQYMHDLPRGMSLAPEFQGQGHCCEELNCLTLHQEYWLSNHAATHTAQKHIQEMEQESKHFIKFKNSKLVGKDPCDIINMDQTTILFSYHSNRTWNKKGMQTIHVRASTTETKRATLAATVTMSGQLLVPLLIFKGAANGRIAKKELTMFAPMAVYAVQKKHGWTNP